MCGIFGYLGNREKSGQLILEGLKSLEYRGYDSWGIAIKSPKSKFKSSRLLIEKKIGKIGEAKTKFLKGKIGIGHTRWATHGGVTKKNAHPHFDCKKNIAVVHNGIVENYYQLKNNLQKANHKFISETDTEVAVHLIEDYLNKHSFTQSVRLAFNKFQGLNALVVMDIKSNTIIAIKTGSPLVIGFGKEEYFLASDASALLPYTKQVYFLKDGEMVKITKKGVLLFNSQTGSQIKINKQILNWQVKQAKLGRFPHFMIKEIFEQPKVLNHILKYKVKDIPEIANKIKKAYGTYIVGCGTAAYAGLCGTYLFSRIAKRHINFAFGSEFFYLTHFLTPKSLVIALSQSGETIDVLDSIKKAKEKKAKIMAITNVLGSSLYRLADYKVLLNAGPEKCVLSTKSFTAKLAILLLLAKELNGGLENARKTLKKAIKEIENLISKEKLTKIKNLADLISSKKHIYIIGRGLSYPIALEGALKIKEVSYIHAEGFAGGELKHGVIALIEKGTPCIIYAPDDETYGGIISNAMEIKARGGLIIGVSYKKNPVFDHFIKISDCGDAVSIPNTVFAQLLAYYLALKKGTDPDKPRNLAKSVTVK